mgnify:CR=1 FL=1
MRNSLTFRLIATSFIWVGAALLVTAVLLVLLFRGHIENHFNRSLQDHLEELVSASNVSQADVLQMTWRPSDPRFNRPHSGWYWEIQQSGISIARSDSLWRDSLKVAVPGVNDVARIQQPAIKNSAVSQAETDIIAQVNQGEWEDFEFYGIVCNTAVCFHFYEVGACSGGVKSLSIRSVVPEVGIKSGSGIKGEGQSVTDTLVSSQFDSWAVGSTD